MSARSRPTCEPTAETRLPCTSTPAHPTGRPSRSPSTTTPRCIPRSSNRVGEEPNTFPIRVYPAWITTLLRLSQPVLLVVAALLLGSTLAGPLDRRRVQIGIGAGVVGLIPFGGLHPVLALVMLVMFTAITWMSIKVLRRLQTGTAA